MGLVLDLAWPRTFRGGMVRAVTVAICFSSLFGTLSAFPFKGSRVQIRPPEVPQVHSRSHNPWKRGHETVDAWSLCPPDMEQMDCFYTYLRLYARLRKASRETDRVSMRNIGKRSGLKPSIHTCENARDKFSCFSKLLMNKIHTAHA